MNKDASAAPASAPSEQSILLPALTLGIVLSALPGILLIWVEIWTAVALLDWSLASFILPGIVGLAIVGVVLAIPALWASWRVMWSAIDSERMILAQG